MSTASQTLTALALALAILVSTPALAQNRGDMKKAVELANQAREAFAEDKFLEAADLLEQAYDLVPEPNFIWNIARAYEQAGADQKAWSNYVRFSELEVPDEEREAALERAARYGAAYEIPKIIGEAQDRAELSALRRSNAQMRTALAKKPVDTDSGTGMSLTELGGWTSAGLGIISLGAVATLHLASIGTVEEFNASANGGDRGKYDALKDTLDTRVVTSQVLLGLGLALTATGGTLLYLEYFSDGEEAPAKANRGLRAAPAFGADSAGFIIQGDF